MVISKGPPASPLGTATTQLPLSSALALAFLPRKVMVTCSPLSAVPQTLAFDFCCRTMPSEQMAFGLTSACASVGKKPRRINAMRIFMNNLPDAKYVIQVWYSEDILADERAKINERVGKKLI